MPSLTPTVTVWTSSTTVGQPATPAAGAPTLAQLASMILDSVGDDAQLARLQRQALIPLELGLLDRSVPAPRTPSRLAKLVSDTIDDYRIHHDA